MPNYKLLAYLSKGPKLRSSNLLEKSPKSGFQVSLENFSLAIQFIDKVSVDLFPSFTEGFR